MPAQNLSHWGYLLNMFKRLTSSPFPPIRRTAEILSLDVVQTLFFCTESLPLAPNPPFFSSLENRAFPAPCSVVFFGSLAATTRPFLSREPSLPFTSLQMSSRFGFPPPKDLDLSWIPPSFIIVFFRTSMVSSSSGSSRPFPALGAGPPAAVPPPPLAPRHLRSILESGGILAAKVKLFTGLLVFFS